ncbi:YozE family protein [Staphylococcus ureilyticus]|uniref:YozE family protein n=1 Tax=Staphylococcus ureilyticus TaxID=94138 RepID=UPI0034DCCCA3
MKDHSFYQFALTARGRKDEKGELAEEIFDDLSFPRQEKDFHALSDYIEMQASYTVSMSVFDSLYDEYTEWLKF